MGRSRFFVQRQASMVGRAPCAHAKCACCALLFCVDIMVELVESAPRPDQLVVSALARQIESALRPDRLFCRVTRVMYSMRCKCWQVESALWPDHLFRLSLRFGQTIRFAAYSYCRVCGRLTRVSCMCCMSCKCWFGV